MDSQQLGARAGFSWPPAVHAILWLDAVLLVAAAFALAGKTQALGQGVDYWTWLALAGSALTAVLAALAAFHLCQPVDNQVWTLLPVPAAVLWVAASVLGYLTMPAGVHHGDALAAALKCLKFLLMMGLPLLALIVLMLWRASALAPRRVLTMGALACAGAAASLLMLVSPHAPQGLDLCAHATAAAVVLGIGVGVAQLRQPDIA